MILFIFHHFDKRWNLEQDYVVLQFYMNELIAKLLWCGTRFQGFLQMDVIILANGRSFCSGTGLDNFAYVNFRRLANIQKYIKTVCNH